MRLTIERMRTLVLVAGLLLVATLAAFLTLDKWKNKFIRRDLPRRLGVDIEQEANGFTRVEFRAGQMLYRIHASRERQLKNNHVLLHEVVIEMFGADNQLVDRIAGNEFEWDEVRKLATASGKVDITLSKPRGRLAPQGKSLPALNSKQVDKDLSTLANSNTADEIHVTTSGLTFDQQTGVARTSQPVTFAANRGAGSAVGAEFNAQQGNLTLTSAVHMQTQGSAAPVDIAAAHAVIDRASQTCTLTQSLIHFQHGDAAAGNATLYLRDNGTLDHVDARDQVALNTMNGSHLSAPHGSIVFDAASHPLHGRMEGGVSIDSKTDARTLHASAPQADFTFGAGGALKNVHIERNASLVSETATATGREKRTWASPVADLAFRDAGHGSVELASLHGSGGVAVASQLQRDAGTASDSHLAADDVTGVFGPHSALTNLIGVGHASIEQSAAGGAHQTATGDRIEAKVAANSAAGATTVHPSSAGQIESATLTGHVVIVNTPAAQSGSAAVPVRSTAAMAVFDGATGWLHLNGNPQVVNGGLELAADKIDVSQTSSRAHAEGNVRATWFQDAGASQQGASGAGFGGRGPVHIVSQQASVNQATGDATFQGAARLWQEGSSISAPTLTLNRASQVLTAQGAGSSSPVQVALINTAAAASPAQSSVIRVSGSMLRYSGADRKALMQGSNAAQVSAVSSEATTTSNELELTLLPNGAAAGQSQIDRITARGRVRVDSLGRHGTGDQLTYTAKTGDYVLTGTPAAPPRMVDPVQGTITGNALIFNSRDDSVRVEGGSDKTVTETVAARHSLKPQ